MKRLLREPPPWGEVWQTPALVAGVMLFVLGLVALYQSPEPPRFDEALSSAEQFLLAQNIEAGQKQLETIKEQIEAATPEQRSIFHQLWADATYLTIELARYDERYDLPENYRQVIRHYEQAEKFGTKLSPLREQRMAASLVALDRDEEALRRIDRIPETEAKRRYAVVRQIIERELERHGGKAASTQTLLQRFRDELRAERDTALRREQEIWATALSAQAMLESGEAQRVIDVLLRQIAVFSDRRGDDDLAPLFVKLGQAYLTTGDYAAAKQAMLVAQSRLEPGEGLNAPILVGLAQVELVGLDTNESDPSQADNLRRALELYSRAEQQFPSEPSYLDALIGRAYCESRLGDHPLAIEHFSRAVERLLDQPQHKDKPQSDVEQFVLAQFAESFQHDEHQLALDYLTLLTPLYADADLPAQLLIHFAETHEALAQRQRRIADGLSQQLATTQAWEQGPSPQARKHANREAAIQFEKAADYYARHARSVTITDDEGFGLSLWQAAINYAEAQQWSKAIDTFSEFVQSRPTDPRHLEGIHRLGLAYQADAQYTTARDHFQTLIERYPTTLEAYKSIVPLAQCFIALNNHDEAKRWLNFVIEGMVAKSAGGERIGGGITPDSLVYRDALIELGKLHYHLAEYEPAIRRLTEAVDPQRYGLTEQGPGLQYYLADANRLSIEEIDRELDGPLPSSRRQALIAERAKRLTEAQALFTRVLADFEAREEIDLRPLERVMHRNAYFYRADCAFDLRRFDEAIELYEVAAQRFEQHPAALVAMVQIVNAYCEMDQPQKAKLANERARWLLNRIPDDQFDDPTLPMTRKHWQDWLRWSNELNLFGAGPDRTAAVSDG